MGGSITKGGVPGEMAGHAVVMGMLDDGGGWWSVP